jgi:hypothetical protein
MAWMLGHLPLAMRFKPLKRVKTPQKALLFGNDCYDIHAAVSALENLNSAKPARILRCAMI